jgi:hypothetical protein
MRSGGRSTKADRDAWLHAARTSLAPGAVCAAAGATASAGSAAPTTARRRTSRRADPDRSRTCTPVAGSVWARERVARRSRRNRTTCHPWDVMGPCLHVFLGTKAQYIKTAPLLRLMDERTVRYRLIDSGQHARLATSLRTSWPCGIPTTSSAAPVTSTRAPGPAMVGHPRRPARLGSAAASRGLRRRRRHLHRPRRHALDVARDADGSPGRPPGRPPGGGPAVPQPAPPVPRGGDPAPRHALVGAAVRTHDRGCCQPRRHGRAGAGRGGRRQHLDRGGGSIRRHRRARKRTGRRQHAPGGEPAQREGRPPLPRPAAAPRRRAPGPLRRHGPTRDVLARKGALGPSSGQASTSGRSPRTPSSRRGSGPHRSWSPTAGRSRRSARSSGCPTLLWRARSERPDGLGANIVLSRYEPAVVDAFVADPERLRRPPADLRVRPSARILDVLERSSRPP